MLERLVVGLLALWVARVTGDCGKPPILENGLPVDPLATSPVGTRLVYRCFPGYVFQEGDSRHITCRENSTWSPLRAVCKPRNCGNPGEILNGYYTASATTLGSKVYFYCDKGFDLVGRNYRVCTASGWSGQVPKCEIVQCPEPPSIANGTVSPSSFVSDYWPYGSVARYSCLENYALIGEKTITCTVTGEWDKDPPRCKVVRCNLPLAPANGRVVAGFKEKYTYLDTITYQCNEGFAMVGRSVIECQENSTFVPLPPTCERDCGKPPVLKNGSPVNPSTTFPVGTNITYRCHTGYVFREGSSKLITCRKDGTWSPFHSVCELINCGKPGELLHGYYNVTDTTFGNKAYFYCYEGYRIVGRNYQNCTTKGWDGQVPTCEIVQCRPPPHIANGTVSSSDNNSWPYGSIARYSCLQNYSLIGEKNITCTATGKWDKDPPRCQAPSSVPPPDTTPSSGGCEGHIGQRFELLFILGVLTVFLT